MKKVITEISIGPVKAVTKLVPTMDLSSLNWHELDLFNKAFALLRPGERVRDGMSYSVDIQLTEQGES